MAGSAPVANNMLLRTSGTKAGERFQTSLKVVDLQGLEYGLDKVGLVRCGVCRYEKAWRERMHTATEKAYACCWL